MNTTYHIKAATYEEYQKILQEMIDAQDPALCCANVAWEPVKMPKEEELC